MTTPSRFSIEELVSASSTSSLTVRVAPSAPGSVLPWAGPHADLLLPLWLVAAGAVGIASACFAISVIALPTAYPRWAAVFNPLLLVAALALGSLPFAALRGVLVPAAPNVAHLVFFLLSTLWLARSRPAGASASGRPAPTAPSQLYRPSFVRARAGGVNTSICHFSKPPTSSSPTSPYR